MGSVVARTLRGLAWIMLVNGTLALVAWGAQAQGARSEGCAEPGSEASAEAGAGESSAAKADIRPPRITGAVCETRTSDAVGRTAWREWTVEASAGGLTWTHPDGRRQVWTACDGLPITAILSVAADAERVYIGTRGRGVHALHPISGQIERVSDEPALDWPTALAVAEHPSGAALWVGTVQDGLWKLDVSPAGAFGSPSQPLRRFRSKRVSALATDSRSLFIGRDLGGLWRYSLDASGRDKRVLRGSVQGLSWRGDGDGDGDSYASALWVDRGGEQCRLDGKRCVDSAVALPAAPAEHGLPDSHLAQVAVAPSLDGTTKALWAAGFDSGLAYRMPGDAQWTRLVEPGAPRWVNQVTTCPAGLRLGAIRLERPTLCAASNRGVYVRHSSGWLRLDERAGLVSPHINSMAAGVGGDGGPEMWLATSEGVVRWTDRGVQTVDEGLPHRIAYGVTTSDDRVWVGTAHGLGALPRGQSAAPQVWRRGVEQGGLADDWANAVVALPGAGVLVGSYDAGIDIIEGNEVRHLWSLGDVWVNPNGLTRLDSLRATAVSTLGDGLVLLHDDGRWQQWTQGDLPSDDVTGIAQWEGEFWIATRSGLARWTHLAAPDRSGTWSGPLSAWTAGR